jgi:hypothetical protein
MRKRPIHMGFLHGNTAFPCFVPVAVPVGRVAGRARLLGCYLIALARSQTNTAPMSVLRGSLSRVRGFLVCESRWVIVEPVGFLGFG